MIPPVGTRYLQSKRLFAMLSAWPRRPPLHNRLGAVPSNALVTIRTERRRPVAETGDPDAEVAAMAARYWGLGSYQYRCHLAFAAHRCPECDGPLAPSPHSPTARRCERCRLSWFAQFSERDGSAKPGSLIAYFTFD
jgi:hypothetical protein